MDRSAGPRRDAVGAVTRRGYDRRALSYTLAAPNADACHRDLRRRLRDRDVPQHSSRRPHASRRMRGRRVAGGHVASGHRGRIPRRHPGTARGRHLFLRHRSRERHHRSRRSETARGGRRQARSAAIPVLPDHGRCCGDGLAAGGIRRDAARDAGCEAFRRGPDVDGSRDQCRHQCRRPRADQPVRHRHEQHSPSGRHRSQSPYAPGRRDGRECGSDCCRHMVVPGLEPGHGASRLRNGAGGQHAHDSPHSRS